MLLKHTIKPPSVERKEGLSSLPAVSYRRHDRPVTAICVADHVYSTAYDFQEFADMLRELYPEQKERFALGAPGKYMYRDPGVYVLTNEKSQRELGITCKPQILPHAKCHELTVITDRPKQETLKDAFDRFFALEKQGLK